MLENDTDIIADCARALIYVAPRQARIQPLALSLFEEQGSPVTCLVRALWSGISRGTERLVFEGFVPPSEYECMRAPHQSGGFPFPVKYGYAAVGLVEDGPHPLRGKHVFALHPHQDRFILPADALFILPEAVPPRRAILAANMETALNALWDSGASAGDRIAVIGAGIIGLLVAALAARLPGSAVTVVDVVPDRQKVVEALGARFAHPKSAPQDMDVVFHASATEAGLATAIAAAGMEAKIVEMSWYGNASVTVLLGGAFHSRRLQLISSQVGQISPAKRSRWSHRRRLEAALSLLADPVFDALITEEVTFEDLPDQIGRILARGAPGLATAICYA